jgi:RNA polymerase sporulation-specific sigma factor
LKPNAQAEARLSFNPASDEEVIRDAKAGDGQALEFLINKYKSFVRAKARTYFLIGADREDIIQEGMIGLYKAIRDFREDKLSSFRAFAELCITRQIITAIKSATRNKHMPLNYYISLNSPSFENENERTLFEVVSEETASNPEDIMLVNEAMAEMQSKVTKQLSTFEKNVLSLFLEGLSYFVISQKLGKQQKSIDNAIQRIKKKLYKFK